MTVALRSFELTASPPLWAAVDFCLMGPAPLASLSITSLSNLGHTLHFRPGAWFTLFCI